MANSSAVMHPLIASAFATAIAPRRALTVSEWADAERYLSSKGSAEPGRWRTSRNPPLREPMDALSGRSRCKDVVLMFPIQFGKTEVAANVLGYTMGHAPGPIMVALPAEISAQKWIAQKLNPMVETTPAVREALTSLNSRDAANRAYFKDFKGGQLYIEHAGSPARLKSTSVRTLVVDELDEFAANLHSGDDPVELVNGRTSAFPATAKRLYISTPGIRGVSRIEALYEKSDRRTYHVPCPHCGEFQPLEWSGLHWSPDADACWYVCRECGAVIEEHHKTAMISSGRWVPENPEASIRGYRINGLYYQIGLGPRWLDLVRMWRDAQGDPARLKTFLNDRLAETWEDQTMKAVRHNVVADRAEAYPLRWAPEPVVLITAGVDTQDDRLEVQLVGWGQGLRCWVLDYHVVMGDPALDETWVGLTDYLNRPIEHANGGELRAHAVAVDGGGHRTEAVKNWVRSRMVTRPFVIFGAVPNNAPVLSRGNQVDVNWKGKLDKKAITVRHVGTVGVKHLLFSRLSADADLAPEKRWCHFSENLPDSYFPGLISETYNPSKNRFEKRRGGARNEVLDTWVYAYAATHHPEIRAQTWRAKEWEAMAARTFPPEQRNPVELKTETPAAPKRPPVTQAKAPRRGGFVGRW